MTHMPHLRLLYSDMKKKHWVISGCYFNYIDWYHVLIKMSPDSLCKLKYYMNFEFIDTNDRNKYHLEIAVNPFSGFTADINGKNSKIMWKIIMNYFGVKPNGGGKGFVNRFFSSLDKDIPKSVPNKYPKSLNTDIIKSLGNNDPHDDYDRIYLRYCMNNPKGRKRSVYNDNKTRLLYPKTYKDVLSNTSHPERVSFVYSADPRYKNNYKNL